MIQVDFTVPDLGQWQWRCWRKDGLKSYLEVRIDITTGNRTLGERWYLFAAPQNARPETRVKVTAIDLLDASPKNWRWGKREVNQDSHANDSVLHGHPGSWFMTEHRKRDSGSLSSTFFVFFFSTQDSLQELQKTNITWSNPQKEKEGLYPTSYLLSSVYQNKQTLRKECVER